MCSAFNPLGPLSWHADVDSIYMDADGLHDRLFGIGFRSPVQRRTGQTAQRAAAADCRLGDLQLVLTKK